MVNLTSWVSSPASFHLPRHLIPLCDKYYILYWESSYIRDLRATNPSYFFREGIAYQYVLPEDPRFLETDKVVRVSFRKLECMHTGFAIIAPLENKEFNHG